MTETELFSSSAYVEWDAYIVPESVSLLVIGYCKCGRCRKFTCSDITYGFIFFNDQASTHRVINNRIGSSGNSYLLRCWCHTTKLCCSPVAGVSVLQTSTATALALSVAVEPFANPAPSLAVPSHVARLVNFICAFYWGYPHSL